MLPKLGAHGTGVRISATPRTKQSLGFSRPEYRSGQPFHSQWDLPNPGIEPMPSALQGEGVVLYQLSYQGIPIGVHVSLFHTKYFCQGRLCGWIRTWWKERWENKKWDSFCNFGEILEEFYISKTRRFVAGRLRRQGFWLGQLAWTKAEGWAVSLVCGY